MTFEQDFPSLKGKDCNSEILKEENEIGKISHAWFDKKGIHITGKIYPLFSANTITACCIDKSKVKEAIESKISAAKRMGCYRDNEWIFSELLKELGLKK